MFPAMSTAPGNTTACVFPMANGAGFPVGSAVLSALDYLIKVKGCSFMEAMEAVALQGCRPRRRPFVRSKGRKTEAPAFAAARPKQPGYAGLPQRPWDFHGGAGLLRPDRAHL